MNIKFLGSCACDFSPKLESEYKDSFGLNERRASSVLVNGKYLIDAGMHILDSMRIADIDSRKITDIFISHIHDDHFNADNIQKIASKSKTPIRIWVRDDAIVPEIENAEYVRMTPYVKYEVGNGAFITGVIANHDPDASPQHIIVEIDGKKLFYGCDGAWFITKTYDFMKRANFDIAIFDATMGDYNGDYRIGEHNSIPMLRVMLPSLMNEGMITDKTRVIFSHIAPSLHKPHCEIVKTAEELGASVAYDGMEINL